MNFFDPQCQEPPLNHTQFGLCDNQDGSKAYTNITEPNSWIATVKNDKFKTLVFTAVDKCVIKDNEEIGRGRCDCMLTSDEHIYFIELKDEKEHWISDAIVQLESTIQFFIANYDLSIYRHKKAFACNKQRRKFQVIDNERNLRFFREYSFRIDVQTEIIVV